MTEPRKLRVFLFLCHSSLDKPIVRELYQRLNAEGWIDPWLDKEKLLPGQEWELEIEKSVEISDVVVVCLSKNSVEKEGYFQKEIKKVLDLSDQKPEGTIFIIPLRLDDCEPPRRLVKWQYVDYFPKQNQRSSYLLLTKSLKIRLDQITRREAEGLRSKEPERKILVDKKVTRNQEDKKEISKSQRKPVTQSNSRRALLTSHLEKIDKDLQILYAIATREQNTVVDSFYKNNPSEFTNKQFRERQINLYEQTRKISQLEMERRKVLDALKNTSL